MGSFVKSRVWHVQRPWYPGAMTSAQIARRIAELFQGLHYSVSTIVHDPTIADHPFVFFVDDRSLMDADGYSYPTSVHVYPKTLEVKFNGSLARELEDALHRTAYRS